MAKTHRSYIFVTFIFSTAAVLISIASLSTQEWVTARTLSITGEHSPSEDFLRIGLFGGVFFQVTQNELSIPLEMTCSFKLNICAALCGSNLEENLERIYNRKSVSEEDLETCYGQSLASRRPILKGENYDSSYLNAGVWLSTVIFLIISIVVGAFSAILAMYNIASNPTEKCFNVFGLYIYNLIASCCIIIAIMIWGVMFNITLTKNVPTYQTIIQEFTTKDRASLGYSYWMNLGALTCYLFNLCLMYVRNYVISLEVKQNIKKEENANPLLTIASK